MHSRDVASTKLYSLLFEGTGDQTCDLMKGTCQKTTMKY
jgi:hypothetical protein